MAESRASNPPTSTAFEWLMALLAILLIAGLTLDIWAHNHGEVDQSFFTPWHAVLYGAMALNGIVLGSVMAVNVLRKGYPWRRALPVGYGLSLIGVFAFAIGGGLDLWWHTIFGIEVSTDALLSPTHLVLATSAALIFTGPLRSAAFRLGPETPARYSSHGPPLLSATATLTLLGMFTQYAHPLVIPFGQKSTAATVNPAIFITRLNGSQQTRVVVDPQADDWGPAVDPSGKRIAYRRANDQTGTSDVVTANIDGSNSIRLTHSGRHDTQPAWAPNGAAIAYVSSPANTSGDYELNVVPAAGGAVRTLIDQTTMINGPAWSPDGKTIAFGSRHESKDWIGTVPAAGGDITWLVAGYNGGWPAYSPDGQTIAFALDAGSGNASIYTMDVAGTRARRLSPLSDSNDQYPAWSPDGRFVAFSGSGAGTPQIEVMRADGTNLVDATRNPALDSERPSFAHDGRIVFAGAASAPRDETQNQDFGIASFLLQTILTMGFVLLLVRRWRVPAGGLTIMLGYYALSMAIINDLYVVLWSVVASAIVADFALLALGEHASRSTYFYAFAFCLPVLMTALYESALSAHAGLGWPPNIILGLPVVTGVAGLLLAFAFRPPLAQTQASSL
jgi:Tol biopolymer transport system component